MSDKAPFLDLVQGDEQAVYADKGYHGWWYRQELARRGIEDGIMRSAARRVRLSAADHARNRAIGRIRAAVERSFATMKRWYGDGRVRYRSLARNGLQLQLLALAMKGYDRVVPGAGESLLKSTLRYQTNLENPLESTSLLKRRWSPVAGVLLEGEGEPDQLAFLIGAGEERQPDRQVAHEAHRQREVGVARDRGRA